MNDPIGNAVIVDKPTDVPVGHDLLDYFLILFLDLVIQVVNVDEDVLSLFIGPLEC